MDAETPGSEMDADRPKKRMTDAERMELARKLDADLEDFIDGLEKKPYAEGWPEDRWQEEMERHPFFMKKAPEPGDELHPLYEGLQQLKYDPCENTPDELALSYKEDGNFNYKHKNYRLAILSYTEGIKVKCGNSEIEAALLNNRSAAHYNLKNYRSCLRDCESALKLKPDYLKVVMRAAGCCHATENHNKCLELCDRILETNPTHSEALALRKSCVSVAKTKERDARLREARAKKKSALEAKLLEEIRKRNINMEDGIDSVRAEYPKRVPELGDNRVHLDPERGGLVWPVILFYPEYKTLDLIERFPEDDRLADQARAVFQEPPAWDAEGKYTMGNLNVYFENVRENKVFPVDTRLTLREILSLEKFLLRGGTPSFVVFAGGSPAEKDFLSKY